MEKGFLWQGGFCPDALWGCPDNGDGRTLSVCARGKAKANLRPECSSRPRLEPLDSRDIERPWKSLIGRICLPLPPQSPGFYCHVSRVHALRDMTRVRMASHDMLAVMG